MPFRKIISIENISENKYAFIIIQVLIIKVV